jgi:hypothetical protein
MVEQRDQQVGTEAIAFRRSQMKAHIRYVHGLQIFVKMHCLFVLHKTPDSQRKPKADSAT